MRTLAAMLLFGLSSACTSTVMAEPRLLVSPYYAIYQVRGKVGMQSQPTPADPIQDNAPQDLRTFGQGHHEDDVGVRVDLGDGFAGARLDYLKLNLNTTGRGILDADWGHLQKDDIVKMQIEADDLRLGWIEPVAKIKTTWREHPLRLQFGAGGTFAHRSMILRAATEDGARKQNAVLIGDEVFGTAHARATWREVSLDAEYAISPHLQLSGDYRGVQQDLELRASYAMPMRDITFFAGYRYSQMPARGDANGFRYDADLRLDGFQLGLVVSF